MFFLISLASVCLRLRTISSARLTAETSMAAAVTMVLAGAGSACDWAGAAGTGSTVAATPSCGNTGRRAAATGGASMPTAFFDPGLPADFPLSGFCAAFFVSPDLALAFASPLDLDSAWLLLALASTLAFGSALALGSALVFLSGLWLLAGATVDEASAGAATA